MPSMFPCPKCGEYSFHKSHTKNKLERLKKIALNQRPYRCHKCGYRSWVKRRNLKPGITLKQTLIYIGVFLIAVFVSILLKGFIR